MGENRKYNRTYLLIVIIACVMFTVISTAIVTIDALDPSKASNEQIRGHGTELVVSFMNYRCKEGTWPKPGSYSFSPYYVFRATRTLPDGTRLDQYIAQNGELWDIELDDGEPGLKFYVNRSRYKD